jgi:hypothetical protein
VLEAIVNIARDDRLFYFSNAMPKSSGKHSNASSVIRKSYGGKCLFCGSAKATLAHLVAGNSRVSYDDFNFPHYRDNLDVTSPRNFIPLCGTLGESETCHHQFDVYKMSLLFDPFLAQYRIFCLDSRFSKYTELNNKVVAVDPDHPPYRRLLAWRARKCVNEHSYLMADRGEKLLEFAKFSDASRSVNNETKSDDEL